ncbi:unnamed protein product [Acanthoscelides obtectus]|uniref:Uncharacterized protein n=1 Tax=Acanthoscelides obtectus TaxID=200917 RepID=A0A9P0P7S0_ACAOB|nr:unnamed protein product [Acanthoscelides obtectus]CAK1636055.1 hypothetical protein AOBTE_LOCUS9711 [Acanthoscelides obtectus]
MYFGCVCFLNVSLNSNLLIEVAIQVDILRQKTITSEVQHLQHIALMAYFGCEILILCTGLFRLTAGISVADLGFMLPLVAAMAQMLYINCLYGSEIIYR